jgi:hypothetical protein
LDDLKTGLLAAFVTEGIAASDVKKIDFTEGSVIAHITANDETVA